MVETAQLSQKLVELTDTERLFYVQLPVISVGQVFGSTRYKDLAVNVLIRSCSVVLVLTVARLTSSVCDELTRIML